MFSVQLFFANSLISMPFVVVLADYIRARALSSIYHIINIDKNWSLLVRYSEFDRIYYVHHTRYMESEAHSEHLKRSPHAGHVTGVFLLLTIIAAYVIQSLLAVILFLSRLCVYSCLVGCDVSVFNKNVGPAIGLLALMLVGSRSIRFCYHWAVFFFGQRQSISSSRRGDLTVKWEFYSIEDWQTLARLALAISTINKQNSFIVVNFDSFGSIKEKNSMKFRKTQKKSRKNQKKSKIIQKSTSREKFHSFRFFCSSSRQNRRIRSKRILKRGSFCLRIRVHFFFMSCVKLDLSI